LIENFIQKFKFPFSFFLNPLKTLRGQKFYRAEFPPKLVCRGRIKCGAATGAKGICDSPRKKYFCAAVRYLFLSPLWSVDKCLQVMFTFHFTRRLVH
jgi:hypothetical protein